MIEKWAIMTILVFICLMIRFYCSEQMNQHCFDTNETKYKTYRLLHIIFTICLFVFIFIAIKLYVKENEIDFIGILRRKNLCL